MRGNPLKQSTIFHGMDTVIVGSRRVVLAGRFRLFLGVLNRILTYKGIGQARLTGINNLTLTGIFPYTR